MFAETFFFFFAKLTYVLTKSELGEGLTQFSRTVSLKASLLAQKVCQPCLFCATHKSRRGTLSPQAAHPHLINYLNMS